MKSVILFLLFLGLFLIVHNIYEGKLQEERKKKKIEYKFIPRSIYEDQFDDSNISTRFGNMFASIDLDSNKPFTLGD